MKKEMFTQNDYTMRKLDDCVLTFSVDEIIFLLL